MVGIETGPSMPALVGGAAPPWVLEQAPDPASTPGHVVVRVIAAGLQLARALGASRVLATTTSSTKATALRGAEADVVIDTSNDDLSDAVKAATGVVGVDVVLDHVGGERFGALLEATRPHGTVINIGRLGGRAATVDVLAFRRIRPIVDRVVALDRAQEAADLMASGTVVGKIILDLPDADEDGR